MTDVHVTAHTSSDSHSLIPTHEPGNEAKTPSDIAICTVVWAFALVYQARPSYTLQNVREGLAHVISIHKF